MAAEVWTLDALALNDASSYVLMSVDCAPPPKRPEWISGADADGEALLRDPLHANRTITLKIRVMPQASMDLALAKIGQIVDKLEEAERQEDGLALVWTPQGATKTMTFYVLSGEIPELAYEKRGENHGWFRQRPQFTVRLVCKPFGYGAEVTGSNATSSNPIVTVAQAGVTGDVPAEGRIVLTDMAFQTRQHAEWGLEWRNYDAGTSNIVESDNMTTSGFAGTGATRTGAYDPGGAGNSVIRASLFANPVAVCGTGNLGHVGTFRVKARVYATSIDVGVRLAWQDGDGPFTTNDYAVPAVANAFCEVDLGLITIPAKKLGTQRWTGRVEAYTTTAGTTIDVDYLLLIPAGEGYGKASTPVIFQTPTTFPGRDEFNQGAGALAGKAAAAGGNWAGAGDADDFVINTASHVAERSAVSDAGPIYNGRFGTISGLTHSDVIVQVDYTTDNNLATSQGVVLRWVSINSWLAVYNTAGTITVQKRVGGTLATVATLKNQPRPETAWLTLRAACDAQGRWAVWHGLRGFDPTLIGQGWDADLAAGGTLASGESGLLDLHVLASAQLRWYDNFWVAAPTARAVVFSGQSIEFRSDDPLREDSTGTYWGSPPAYRGSRFLLPPAGDENRTSRIVVKARRNDVDTAADDQIADSTKVEILYTPRYLVVPR